MKQVYGEKNQDDGCLMGVGGMNWEEALQIILVRRTYFNWVGQKVRSRFLDHGTEKLEQTFWPTRHIIRRRWV